MPNGSHDDPSGTKRVVLVHGRSFKPNESELLSNWIAALKRGLSRDHPEAESAFDGLVTNGKLTMAYYGDKSNAFLLDNGLAYDEARDIRGQKNRSRRASAFYSTTIGRQECLQKPFPADDAGRRQ